MLIANAQLIETNSIFGICGFNCVLKVYSVFFNPPIKKIKTVLFIHSLIKIAFIFFTEYSLSRENEALSCLMKCLGLQLVWRAEDKKLTVNKTMQNAYFPNIKKNEFSSVPQS